LLPFISFPLCLFLILDYFRIKVSFGNELVPKGLYTFSKWTTPIAFLFTSMIHLWFVNDPDKNFPDGYGFIAHYAPYAAFQVALAIIAIQQVWYHIAVDNIPFDLSPRVAMIYLKLAVFLPFFYQMCVISILIGTPIFDSLKGGDEGTWERVVFKALTRIYPVIAMVVPIICSFWEVFLSKDPNKFTTFTIEVSNNNISNVTVVKKEASSNRNVIKNPVIVAFSLFVVGLLTGALLINHGDVVSQSELIIHEEELSQSDNRESETPKHWPSYLVSRMMPPKNSIVRPTNTIEAAAKESGWVKSDESCDPFLGEPWLYNGKHSYNTSVTMYFTPSVGDKPGILSGIEVDVYGFVDESLVGSYFSKPRESNDGTYHSIAVALQNGAQHDLCDSTTPFVPNGEKYLAIRSGFTYNEIPTNSTMPALRSQWVEGSYMQLMGIHWFQDTEGGRNLSYKAGKLVPISIMYDRIDKGVNAIFFLGTGSKTMNSTDLGTWWDKGPGLVENASDPGPAFCDNFCGDCAFTGSPDGYYSTMHWWFKNPMEIPRVGKDFIYCEES